MALSQESFLPLPRDRLFFYLPPRPAVGLPMGPGTTGFAAYLSGASGFCSIGDEGLSQDSTFSLETFNLSLECPVESYGEEPMIECPHPVSAASRGLLSNSLKILAECFLLTTAA